MIHRVARLAVGLGLVCASAWPSWSHETSLSGELVQGALIQGKTPPGTKLTVGGRRIRVSSNGNFVFGLGRDAPKRVELRAVYGDGRTYRMKLKIRQRRYNIERIDGPPKAKVSPSPQDLKRIGAESALIKAARARDTDVAYYRRGFVWPLRGRISGVYGSQRVLNGEPRRPHLGVDIAAPTGTAIVATADGVVRIAHGDMFFTGKTVAIDHGHGVLSIYAHMSEIAVENGQRVAKGTRIGRVGATGRVTGPHLHWGVSLFKKRLDPALLVGPMTPAKGRH